MILNDNYNDDTFLSGAFKKFLLNHMDDFYHEISYVSFHLLLKQFYVKKSNKDNFIKTFKNINHISESDNGYVLINGNQKLKFGKLLSHISKSVDIQLGNNGVNEIERFVNFYKSWYESSYNPNFKILKGEQILNGYNDWNYTKRHSGMLGGSCMNNKTDLLDLYVENENKVQLLTLFHNRDKISGRALLWTLDNKPYKFMDRVYGAQNYIVNMFRNYAKENGFAYRDQDNHKHYKIYTPNSKHYDYPSEILFKTKLDYVNMKKMPYLDSLYIFNKHDKTLSNRSGKTGIYRICRSTRGYISGKEVKLFGIKLKSYDGI